MERLLTTEELAIYIRKNYVEPLLEYVGDKKDIYGVDFIFYREETLDDYEGTFVYSNIQGYHYVGIERRTIRTHQIMSNLLDVVYRVLDNYVWNYASNYAAIHSDGRKNYRRLLFAKEKELWKILDESGYKRKCKEIEETLKRYPYEDSE